MITLVDKAANRLCIICKACYVQLTKAEMEGPEYSRVEGEDLVSIKSVIVKRQWDFLRQEFSPIPQIRKRSEKNPLQIVLAPTDRLPVRYVVDVVVVFTLKAVPVSTQYFLTSVLVQLTRTPSVVTG